MVNYPMSYKDYISSKNCSQIFEMFPTSKKTTRASSEPLGAGPWSTFGKETGPRTNKPTKPGQYEKPRKQIPTPPAAKLHGNTMFPEQIHRFASSLIPPNNGYIVVKVDGDRHSQVRWRFVFVNTWELRHLVCWWYG